MRRDAWAWRRRAPLLAAAALFLIANAAFFVWYRGTSRQRAAALESRRVALQAEVTAQEREAERLEVQRQKLSRVSSAIEEFYGRRIGSRRDTLAPIVEEVHATLKRVGVSPSEISYETLPLENLPLSRMQIRFGLKADYAKFKRLLAEFETGRRWIVVREISLARDPETPGAVQVRLVLGTYFSREEGEAAPRRAATLPRRTAA